MPASSEPVVVGTLNAPVDGWPPPNMANWPELSMPPSADEGTPPLTLKACAPPGMVMVAGTAELSKTLPLATTDRPATFAWCRMVTLPVPAGTAKLTVSPTLCVPRASTCAVGSVLVSTGREQAAGVQAAEGRQTLPSVPQQM